EIGYSKRTLSDLLDSFVQSGFFDVSTTRNQRIYRFIKRDQMTKALGSIPVIIPPWRLILEVLLPLRHCIQQVENKSGGTRITEIRNTLAKTQNKLHKLNLTPPPMRTDFIIYWDSFSDWILNIIQSYAKGNVK